MPMTSVQKPAVPSPYERLTGAASSKQINQTSMLPTGNGVIESASLTRKPDTYFKQFFAGLGAFLQANKTDCCVMELQPESGQAISSKNRFSLLISIEELKHLRAAFVGVESFLTHPGTRVLGVQSVQLKAPRLALGLYNQHPISQNTTANLEIRNNGEVMVVLTIQSAPALRLKKSTNVNVYCRWDDQTRMQTRLLGVQFELGVDQDEKPLSQPGDENTAMPNDQDDVSESTLQFASQLL